MDEKRYYTRLGLFVVASVVLLCALLFILGGRSLFQPTSIVETYFDDSVAGLDVGAPMRFRGVPLGQVSFIGMSTVLYEQDVPVDQRKGYIVVRVRVTGPRTEQWQKELDEYVKRGLRVRTQLGGITGQLSLAVDLVDPKTTPQLPFNWTPQYAYLPSAPSFTSQIMSSIQNLVSNLDKADIQQLGQNLNALVINVNRKLDEVPLAQLSADAGAVLKDARVALNHVNRIVSGPRVEELIGNLSSASGRVDKLLSNPELGHTVANASALSARLRNSAENGELDRIMKNLDRALQRTDALLAENQYDLRGVVQDLRVTAANFRRMSETARNFPPGLLVGGPPQKVELPNDSKAPLPNNSKKESK